MNPDKRILIIDPTYDECMVTASFIRSEGFEVGTGRSLADALKQLNEVYYPCLIMDVELPEMKGYEAVSILKKHPSSGQDHHDHQKKYSRTGSQSQRTGYFLLFHQILW